MIWVVEDSIVFDVSPPLPGPVGSVPAEVDDSMVSVVELGPCDVQVVFDHDE